MPRTVLRDDQWDRMKGFLPGKSSDCGVTAKDNRLFVEAVLTTNRLLNNGVGNLPTPHQRHHRTYQEELFHAIEANDWPTSGQGGIHQLPSRTFTGRNEGGYFVGLL